MLYAIFGMGNLEDRKYVLDTKGNKHSIAMYTDYSISIFLT